MTSLRTVWPGPSGAVGGSPISNCRMRFPSTLTAPSSKRTFWPPWAMARRSTWRSGSRGSVTRTTSLRRMRSGTIHTRPLRSVQDISSPAMVRMGQTAVATARAVPRTAARMRRRDTRTPVRSASIPFPGGPAADGQPLGRPSPESAAAAVQYRPPRASPGCACRPRSAAGPRPRRGCRPAVFPEMATSGYIWSSPSEVLPHAEVWRGPTGCSSALVGMEPGSSVGFRNAFVPGSGSRVDCGAPVQQCAGHRARWRADLLPQGPAVRRRRGLGRA